MKRQGERREHQAAKVMLAVSLLLAGLAGGCAQRDERGPMAWNDEREFNTETVNAHFDRQAQEGALATRTLYPHHFTRDEAVLNGLGERKLSMLSTTRDAAPLRVYVVRGGAEDDLYQQRLDAVRERLAGAGIEKVEFVDEPQAVAGMSSSRVNRALQREQQAVQSGVQADDDRQQTRSTRGR